MKQRDLLIGMFIMILGFAPPISATDVGFYGVLKRQHFVQSSASGPTPGAQPFAWEAFVEASEPDLINSALVQIPGGAFRVLDAEDADNISWRYRATAQTQTALNNTYGSGTYTFSVDSENDIISFAQLSLPADAYPNPPGVSNFVATQNINPTTDFLLSWAPFIGADNDDWIEIDVLDNAGNSVGGANLTASANSLIIPANTLQAGQAYVARILFINVTSTEWSSIPGAQGITGFSAETELSLLTEGYVPPNSDLLVNRSPGGQLLMQIDSTVGHSYTFQWSDNLVGWTNLFTTNASASMVSFEQPLGPGVRFFRVVKP